MSNFDSQIRRLRRDIRSYKKQKVDVVLREYKRMRDKMKELQNLRKLDGE